MTNILFICKANRFRSKIAEAYLKKINKNPKIKIKSAGILQKRSMVHSKTKAILKNEFNITIEGKPRKVNKTLLSWADILVIVADNVNPNIFLKKKFKGKLIIWKVKDARHKDTRGIRRAAKSIVKHINKFVKEL